EWEAVGERLQKLFPELEPLIKAGNAGNARVRSAISGHHFVVAYVPPKKMSLSQVSDWGGDGRNQRGSRLRLPAAIVLDNRYRHAGDGGARRFAFVFFNQACHRRSGCRNRTSQGD